MNCGAYIVRPKQLPLWKQAVEEAVSLIPKTVQQRLDFFSDMFENKTEKKEKLLGIKASIKRKYSKIKDEDFKVASNKVKKVGELSFDLRKHSSKKKLHIKASSAARLAPPKEQPLKTVKQENIVLEQESDTDSSSKISVGSSSRSSYQTQAALFKKNNIFKGALKDKVCQLCEKPDNVQKCGGICGGYYHVNCAVKDNNIQDDINIMKDDTNEIVKPEKSDFKCIENIKTEKVDFKCMSLAEQIDMKMKEIMRKFERKTTYADSASDHSSSEDSNSNAQLSNNSTPKQKKVEHVTADSVTFISTQNTNHSSVKSEDFECQPCRNKMDPHCYVCHKNVSRNNIELRQKCSLNSCARFYHKECLKPWPQTQWSFGLNAKENVDSFVCPSHVCHTCVSDNPRASSRCSNGQLTKCLRCPTTYHISSYCVPAGTLILTTSQIVCPRHTGELNPRTGKVEKVSKTINTTWCFVCSKGGNLICCETCPTSVHVDCLHVTMTEDDKFICEDCESGRFPLYDEVVWVKLGAYRWWPAIILFPNDIPDNVRQLPHSEGEFVVKFFGTQDHYWIGRGRCFLFQEGDQGQGHNSSFKDKRGAIFNKAVEEAKAVHQLKQGEMCFIYCIVLYVYENCL